MIGRVFHELKLIEQWGSGAQRMVSACLEAGLPPPLWEEVGFRMRVTLRLERIGPIATDPTEKKILDLIGRSEDGLKTQEIAQAIELSARATRTRLVKLIARGLVVEVGKSVNDPGKRYFVNAKAIK